MSDLIRSKNILSQIYYIRDVKVMFDFHLAALYDVETRVLKQQVRRNIDRFPEDFIFDIIMRSLVFGVGFVPLLAAI